MNFFKTKLKSKEYIAENTLELVMEKPEGFEFSAGQYVEIAPENILYNDKKKGNFRDLSISSAPEDSFLSFAVRLSNSNFKKSLTEVSVGDAFLLSPAMGNFILDKKQNTSLVFLVGGIGITPVRSILRSLQLNNIQKDVHLFYSNRRPGTAVYLDEINEVGLSTFVPNMTDNLSVEEWGGEKGVISLDMLNKYLLPSDSKMYYVVGSPIFVQKMSNILELLMIDYKNIKREDFAGY